MRNRPLPRLRRPLLRSFNEASDYDIIEKVRDDSQKNNELLEKNSEQVVDNCDITEEIPEDLEPVCCDKIDPDKHSENLEEKTAEKPDIVDCIDTERIEENPAVGEIAKGDENMRDREREPNVVPGQPPILGLNNESVRLTVSEEQGLTETCKKLDQEEESGLNSNDGLKKENLGILESPECDNGSRDIVTENMTIEEKNNESFDDTVDVECVVELDHSMSPTFVEGNKEFSEQMNSDIEAETDFEKFEEPVTTHNKQALTILENNFSNQKSEIIQNDENSQIVENDEIKFTSEETLVSESKLNDYTTRILKKSLKVVSLFCMRLKNHSLKYFD